MMSTRWHRCACCDGAAEYALSGNRLLTHKDVHRLPAELAPTVFWRCGSHQRYQMRRATGVQVSEQGDLLYTLTCGHQVCWLFRGQTKGQLAYTPARLEQAITTRQIRLDQPQRCYRCGDLHQGSEATP